MGRKKNTRITGVEFYRCKKRVPKTEIQKLLGGCNLSYKSWIDPNRFFEMSDVRHLIAVSERLGVTTDQLFEIHSTAELDDGDHPQRASKYDQPGNALNNYRIAEGLTFRQLADRLNVTRQCTEIMCRSPRGSKAGMQRICRYEHMKPEDFVRKYATAQDKVV